VRHNDMASIKS